MATIGYIRVSTEGQNTARQDEKIRGMCEKVFTEKISGKDINRPELKRMLDYIREGDTVVVESYSRFSRSTKDLFELIAKLDQKGVGFISLKENVDTTTPQGRLTMTIFAGLAQFEREQLLQRQAEGIAAAKAADKLLPKDQRKYRGRKPIALDEQRFREECTKWRAGEQTAVETMRKLGVRSNTFYRRVKEMGL